MKIKIAPDKWRHFYAGIIMGAVLQLAAFFMFPSLFTAVIFTFLVVVVVSYGFELFSLLTGLGYYDFFDAIATIIGGILGMAIIMVFQIW
jgi:glycopeptide antibiotics resistance protein